MDTETASTGTSIGAPASLAILISGRGSNMRAIVDAIRAGRLEADVRVVISNMADAPGLRWAREAGLETAVLRHQDYSSRDAYDQALVDELGRRGVRLVVLAGFMRVLGGAFCAAFPNGILNVHPSLLPAFPGVNAQRQAFEHGAKVSGATVHFVTPDLDAGPIVMQEAVSVDDCEDAAALAARVLAVEHRLLPAAIHKVLHEDWTVQGRRFVERRVRGHV